VEIFHITVLIPKPDEFTFFFAPEVHFMERIATTVFFPGPRGHVDPQAGLEPVTGDGSRLGS
jgi:hypothetical protein